jgi:RHS repeat-associated protein
MFKNSDVARLHAPSFAALALRSIVPLLLAVGAAQAQSSSTDGATPRGIAPGAPAGSHQLSDFDSVNIYNGNLNFSLPLMEVGGRGDASYHMTLKIDKRWTVRHQLFNGSYYLHYPETNWWTPSPGYGAGVMAGRSADEGGCSNVGQEVTGTITRLTFTVPDGTEYELLDTRHGGTLQTSFCRSATGAPRGRVFVTADGTAATFISDTDIYDAHGVTSYRFFPSGVLMLRDGTRYLIVHGKVTSMRDRNGNLLTFSFGSPSDPMRNALTKITDSVGREVNITYAGEGRPYDEISYIGFGGAPRAVRVEYASLESALRPPYAVQSPNQLFGLDGGDYPYNPSVVSSVVLPNNERYSFRYNSYGELARVELPTGGWYEYDWGASLLNGSESGVVSVDTITGSGTQEYFPEIYRQIRARRTFKAPGAVEGETVYGQTAGQGTDTSTRVVSQRDPNSNNALLAQTKHYFYGNPIPRYSTPPTHTSGWGEGKEYQTDTYNVVNGAAVLHSVVSQTWQPGAPVPGNPNGAANPRLVTVETRLEPNGANLVSKRTAINPADGSVGFDQFNNETDVWEYDYGVGAAPAYPLRHTRTDYVTFHNGTDYTGTGVHIRNLPRGRQVYSVNPATGAETLVSQSETRHDEYALLTYPAVVGWENPGAARGNATTTRRWIDTTNTWLENRIEYDQVGNAHKTWDTRAGLPDAERVTQTSYADSFADGVARNTYAFATQTTSPVPDPTNQRATNSPLVSTAVHDYWTGNITSNTDPNGKTTSFQYYDALERPTRIDHPDGGWTVYWYDRNSCGDYIGTRTAINASQNTEGYQFFDGLGRPSRSFQFHNNAADWMTVDTQYDAMGRVWRVSNQYHSGGCGSQANPSERWTTTQYDGLGRVRTVTTPDGAQVVTSYSGNQVTVTDQAGKSRRSVRDALGRLSQVVEAPGAGSCQADGAGCATAYVYDALGNLRKVDQGGQQRFFMYDSLGRLVRAKNPEQTGTISADQDFPALTDPLTGNAQWTFGSSYDANGNLWKRRDARNVTTTYTHDNINRVIRTDYTDGTPMTLRTYDFATNGRGRFYADYESSTSGTINYVLAYDAVGRPTSGQTSFYLLGTGWVPGYTYSRSYDLAGNVTSQTYPSGRTVSYTQFDAAGRLKHVEGNLGDGVARAYSAGISYDEAGRMQEERFGTATSLYHKRHYNVRGQLYDIRLSTVPWAVNDWDWNRGCLAFYYGAPLAPHGQSNASNNGNVTRVEHWVPTDPNSPYGTGGQGPWVVYYQEYQYDALDRLSSATERKMASGAPEATNYTQAYAYDRWGNRTIDAARTWGAGIPAPQFAVDSATNRLGVPAGYGGAMQYDAAGHLTNDTYTGAGARTYDAEGRMTTAWGPALSGGSYQNRYVYDAAGKRTRRQTEAGEAWHVYGFDGELIAEYGAATPPSSPRREYGYRGGELLVVADVGAAQPVAWQNAVGVSVSGGSLTKPGGDAWNAGASSLQTIGSGDGYVEFTAAETHTYRMAGLSNGDSHQSYEDIDFAIYPAAGGGLHVYEGGFYKANLGGYAAGDRLKVAVEGGAVKYYRNDALLYTSGVAPTYPLRVDTSLYSTGATVQNVTLAAGGQGAQVRWLVSDHLGTPRMTADLSGSLTGIRRHDYLPFGEELGAGIGGRTSAQGYAEDGVRQKFTRKERDAETRLDYFIARYYSSALGRFTSPDEFSGGPDEVFGFVEAAGRNPTLYADPELPQSLNKYQYAYNNPLAYVDPDGHAVDDENRKTKERLDHHGRPIRESASAKLLAEFGIELPTGRDLHQTQFHVIGQYRPPPPPPPQRRETRRARSGGRQPRRTGFDPAKGRSWRDGLRDTGIGPWRVGTRVPGRSVTGLVGNRPLRQLTEHEIRNAIREGYGLYVSDHAVQQLKDARTYELGIRTLNDWSRQYNNAIRDGSVAPGRGTRVEVTHGRFKTVIEMNKPTPTIVTVTPR